MKKIYQIGALSLALTAVSIFPATKEGFCQNTALASSISQSNLGVNTTDVTYREGTFNLNQNAALREESLAQVRNIRAKLWDENIYFTNNDDNQKGERLQDVAKANGYMNKQAYVNGLSWSTDLEKIAIQRAYEQTITGGSHQRVDGSSYESAKSANGLSPDGEIIALNTNMQNPSLSFGQWSFMPSKSKNNKSEYELLKEAKGVSNANNGHLHNILNPEFGHIGYAAINDPNGKWNYGVGEFSYNKSKLNDSSTNLVGNYTIYVGNASNRITSSTNNTSHTYTKEEKAKLEEAVKKANQQIDTAEYLMNNYPKTVAGVKDKLIDLIAKSRKLIEKAEPILNK